MRCHKARLLGSFTTGEFAALGNLTDTYEEFGAASRILRGESLPHYRLLEVLLGQGALCGQDPGHFAAGVGLGLSLGRGRRSVFFRLQPVDHQDSTLETLHLETIQQSQFEL